MDGISLSKHDKWLICLSLVSPPLATYLKFGSSRTLAINFLLTACLFVPGVIHAIRSIFSYPSVVFRNQTEPKDKFSARDGSVIWEVPRDHFRSISDSVRVLETQGLALKGGASARAKSAAGLSVMSGAKSLLTAPKAAARSDLYVAHMHGNAPVLNPSYGWSPAAVGALPPPLAPWIVAPGHGRAPERIVIR
ncbi:hypothetical protein GGH94_002197 [Coemansia aciculifera]|uniref:Uncharacterized protein n=1 Tax=Coemansia aciculifera TaxID=417176 RepID=A0A9W8IJJ3_9FUNG|nr:hypothetical protein GGH94_002197 [Coemansia aciculifera]